MDTEKLIKELFQLWENCKNKKNLDISRCDILKKEIEKRYGEEIKEDIESLSVNDFSQKCRYLTERIQQGMLDDITGGRILYEFFMLNFKGVKIPVRLVPAEVFHQFFTLAENQIEIDEFNYIMIKEK